MMDMRGISGYGISSVKFLCFSANMGAVRTTLTGRSAPVNFPGGMALISVIVYPLYNGFNKMESLIISYKQLRPVDALNPGVTRNKPVRVLL
jgi:hypothetical protein